MLDVRNGPVLLPTNSSTAPAHFSTTGFPLGDLNARRAAIRRMVRGAAKDLLIR